MTELNETQQNVLKSLATLIRDAQSSEWIESARLYTLTGESNDPSFVLMLGVMNDPIGTLQNIYDRGMRPGDDALGLCLVARAARHLSFDELAEKHPDALGKLREAMEREGIPNEEYLAVEQYYREKVVPTLPMPNKMSDDMMTQGFFALAVLRDGTTVSAEAADNDEPEGEAYGPDLLQRSQFPKALYMSISGMRPDLECADPVQAANDHRILEALDF